MPSVLHDGPVTMVVTRVALLASVLAFAGCDVGEVPIGGGGGGADAGGGGADPMASAKFTTDIKPILDTQGCTTGGAAGACHGNVQPPVMTSFETLTANGVNQTYAKKPGASNKLVTGPTTIDGTGKHPTGNPMAVPYLDAAQKTTVTTWIDMYGF
jgi:hypothetical protein